MMKTVAGRADAGKYGRRDRTGYRQTADECTAQGHGVRAWLFQIATNLLRDELRARVRGARALGIPRGIDSAAAPGLPADPELTAQLRKLPRAQLEVLLLHA